MHCAPSERAIDYAIQLTDTRLYNLILAGNVDFLLFHFSFLSLSLSCRISQQRNINQTNVYTTISFEIFFINVLFWIGLCECVAIVKETEKHCAFLYISFVNSLYTFLHCFCFLFLLLYGSDEIDIRKYASDEIGTKNKCYDETSRRSKIAEMKNNKKIYRKKSEAWTSTGNHSTRSNSNASFWTNH